MESEKFPNPELLKHLDEVSNDVRMDGSCFHLAQLAKVHMDRASMGNPLSRAVHSSCTGSCWST